MSFTMDGGSSSSDRKLLVREFQDLEELNAREAKSRAVVLEILGDIPDADVAPPKNVLFVCKLNPVTEQDDLKLIFSRFGTVKSCDVIRDYKTGDSLQYAFVEFESEESCNDAYFKMQNVLIDDRRIHVDFCQSVSGFWKRFKEKGTFTRSRRPEVVFASDAGLRHKRPERRYTCESREGEKRGRSRSALGAYDNRHRRSPSGDYHRSKVRVSSRERHYGRVRSRSRSLSPVPKSRRLRSRSR